MIVSAWILLIIFTLALLASMENVLYSAKHMIFFVFCAFTVAISAGIIWGGLFS